MKKQWYSKMLSAVLFFLTMGLANRSYGYDVVLRNDTPYKVEMTVHNARFLGTCKDIKKELQPNPGVTSGEGGGSTVCKAKKEDNTCYYKEGNGICNVKSVTAQVFEVPYIKYDGTPIDIARTTVNAISYKGPRTGTTVDTYVIRAKWDAQGKPMLVPRNASHSPSHSRPRIAGPLVLHNIVDISYVPILDNEKPIMWKEENGKFFNHKGEDITDKVKDRVAYIERFEVVRDPKERVQTQQQSKPLQPVKPMQQAEKKPMGKALTITVKRDKDGKPISPAHHFERPKYGYCLGSRVFGLDGQRLLDYEGKPIIWQEWMVGGKAGRFFNNRGNIDITDKVKDKVLYIETKELVYDPKSLPGE